MVRKTEGIVDKANSATDKPAATPPKSFTLIHQLVAAAKARLEPGRWDYVMGGAETEATLIRNRLALDSLGFRPRVLRDVRNATTEATFLGHKLKLPVILAPIGSIEDLFSDGARGPSNAAARFGCLHMLSSVAEPGLVEIAKANAHPKFFQLYVRGDGAWVDDMVDRVVDTGYSGLALTVDLAYYGRRERDLSRGYHPSSRRNHANTANRSFQEAFNWSDIARIRRRTKLPLFVKGIATAEDAAIALEHGVDVVYVSNHGGRQLDFGKGGIEILPEVVDAVRGRAQIVVDGGIMRGTDIVKAMALGANAVGIGKLQVLAGAAGGENAIVNMLAILADEATRCLGLLGVKSFAELTPRHLTALTPLPGRLGLASAVPLMGEGY